MSKKKVRFNLFDSLLNFFIFKFFFCQREIWSLVNSKHVTYRREMRGVIKAEMFGQLTSGLESAWNRLKGEGNYIFLAFHLFHFFFFGFNSTVCCVYLRNCCDSEVLTKENIVEPMRDIRRALLEADVSERMPCNTWKRKN